MVNCDSNGPATGEPLERMKRVGGKADVPSGKYPKRGSVERFRLLSL
jgi:hypothetical protein